MSPALRQQIDGEDGENCLSISQMLSVSHAVLSTQPPKNKLAGGPRNNTMLSFSLCITAGAESANVCNPPPLKKKYISLSLLKKSVFQSEILFSFY